MYPVDGQDAVLSLAEVPCPNIGAPLPVVVASDNQVLLAYIEFQPLPKDWDGTSCEIVTHHSKEKQIVLVEFLRPRAHFFGPPSDEILSGHPLADRGLKPYSVFEVTNSSWLRAIIRMDSVHPRHDPKSFTGLRHFVFVFHDSTFECIARSCQVTRYLGSLRSALQTLIERLE